MKDERDWSRQKRASGGLWVAVAILLLLLIFPGLVRAEAATFENGIVLLPVVEYRPYNVRAELQVIANTQPLQFQLRASSRTDAPVTGTSAFFDGDFLVIPEVMIGGIAYWADLREIGPGRFILDSYGRNPLPVPPRTEPYVHQAWEWLPGEALDIGVGADGTAWAVGANAYGYDYGLYVWNGYDWYESGGAAVRVDVDALGRPWVINDEHEIWRQERSGGWLRLPGAAHDIGVGADGSVWVLGVEERSGGHEVFTLGSHGWIRMEGSGVRIDVDAEGRPWIINHDDEIYRLEYGVWRRMPGKAKDIGIGADGSVWVIGADARPGGYGIYRFNGAGWDRIPGSARQISVGPNGEPWVVNREGDIYRSIGY